MSTTTNLKVLIIEDDTPKLTAIEDCLREELGFTDLVSARSLSSALRVLQSKDFHLCIVDMSIPTFDFDADKTGGEPQAKGGVDVLRYIQSEAPETKAIIITQYIEFPDGNGTASTLMQVSESLLKKFKHNLIAVLFYASQKSDWRSKLKYAIYGEFYEK
ncbi:response regulator [Pseudomonas sp. MG-2]|uniref:response regulator transcription factor n=1 Tax=Pseudomonas sp. MG-2 TaxID=405714 RepID=UPI001C00041E|nr:response regulator [Pseudomonas sp. MG-2]MBT9234313.1 response regulator [Pseudomonas sp. MG-2]